MVQIYVSLIKKGIKAIDNVPTQIKDLVQAALNKNNKESIYD